ncbi:MAG: CofH family radical SAM protein [Bacteroidales bacterium]|jgi:aminodeoxyfutalosine synthase|nr:CofH family radical SAM protein [Bacteroidales bacterium]
MEGRVGREEAVKLFDENDLNILSLWAWRIKEEKNGNIIWYNRNFHLEPSNVCSHRCNFCSYRRESDSDQGAWSMTLDEIREYCREKFVKGMTEVHVVGSVHPKRDLSYYLKIIEILREELPQEVTIKGFSAVEIDDMSKSSKKSVVEILTEMKKRGLSALPGGGAEIFDSEVRKKICPDKSDAKKWIEIHRTAHKLGIRSNATMLFGHIESRANRVDHLLALRDLQDETGGFDAFIPLLYKSANNPMSSIGEADITEILKTFAISRIVLDNTPHIKSYWPMLGRELCQLTLLYGADDIDGTVNDSTKIYSMAGSQESKPLMTPEELEKIAAGCGCIAVERDSFYNRITKKTVLL